MDYISLLSVWAVAISGPCVISWLAGDLAGSARTRKLYGATDSASDAERPVDLFDVEDWSVDGAIIPLDESRCEAPSPLGFEARVEELALQAESRREVRRRALAPRPARASAAPSSVLVTNEHDAQDARKVLARYRRSQEELQRVNPGRAARPRHQDRPFYEQPGVRIAAPVEPRRS